MTTNMSSTGFCARRVSSHFLLISGWYVGILSTYYAVFRENSVRQTGPWKGDDPLPPEKFHELFRHAIYKLNVKQARKTSPSGPAISFWTLPQGLRPHSLLECNLRLGGKPSRHITVGLFCLCCTNVGLQGNKPFHHFGRRPYILPHTNP
jgi:hypothetical protein